MRNSVIVLMGVVLSSAYGLVSAYHVEPRTAGQSGWTRSVQPNDYVSQVVTMNFDELDSAGDFGDIILNSLDLRASGRRLGLWRE